MLITLTYKGRRSTIRQGERSAGPAFRSCGHSRTNGLLERGARPKAASPWKSRKAERRALRYRLRHLRNPSLAVALPACAEPRLCFGGGRLRRVDPRI